jgi:hypothetical protein
MLKQNFSQKKIVLQNYLTQHNIPFSATDTKKVLYEKIKQNPLIWPETQALVARTYHTPPFSNFLFTNLFSIKFLYFLINE